MPFRPKPFVLLFLIVGVLVTLLLAGKPGGTRPTVLKGTGTGEVKPDIIGGSSR